MNEENRKDTEALPPDPATGQEGDGAPGSGHAAEDAGERYGAEERAALRSVFQATRRLSARSQLMTAGEWEALGLVPAQMEAEDLEMLVYDFLAEAQEGAGRGPEGGEPAQAFRTATTMVGVPGTPPAPSPSESQGQKEEGTQARALDIDGEAVQEALLEDGLFPFAPEDEEGEEEELYPALSLAEAGLPADFEIPEGFALALVEGEPSLVPLESIEEDDGAVECGDIEMLMGKSRYYLYSRDHMSDQYAHWSFLAYEDDRVLTFVDCIREESRVYPRPMPLAGLENPPFRLSREAIEEIWMAVSASGEYPDIGRTAASNGDVYFFSTDYLSATYAASLAEWDAVERLRSV